MTDPYDYQGLNRLVYVVERLFGPGGCPWDQEQTHESLKKHLLEESYELFEAIDSVDDEALKEELGDVLLQPLMHAEMERVKGNWGIHDVAETISEKLIRRHPHVFGDLAVGDSAEVLRNWDAIKKSEKSGKTSILDGVPKATPALVRADTISRRAARAGFEWESQDGVFDKLAEETRELKEAIAGGNPQEIESEVGDLLFTVVNLARWNHVDPEEALRKMLNRFTTRFQAMEQLADEKLDKLTPEQWDLLWNKAKLSGSE